MIITKLSVFFAFFSLYLTNREIQSKKKSQFARIQKTRVYSRSFFKNKKQESALER